MEGFQVVERRHLHPGEVGEEGSLLAVAVAGRLKVYRVAVAPGWGIYILPQLVDELGMQELELDQQYAVPSLQLQWWQKVASP